MELVFRRVAADPVFESAVFPRADRHRGKRRADGLGVELRQGCGLKAEDGGSLTIERSEEDPRTNTKFTKEEKNFPTFLNGRRLRKGFYWEEWTRRASICAVPRLFWTLGYVGASRNAA